MENIEKRGEIPKIPLTSEYRNERCDGVRQYLMPRQKDVPYTVFLEARRLVLNVAGIIEGKKELPSIQEMLNDWKPLEER